MPYEAKERIWPRDIMISFSRKGWHMCEIQIGSLIDWTESIAQIGYFVHSDIVWQIIDYIIYSAPDHVFPEWIPMCLLLSVWSFTETVDELNQ